jgi:hypothetical protein
MVAFPLLPLTGPVVLEALRGVREHLLSYYDAQIWAVTRLGQVAVVLSEGFNPGRYSTGCRSLTRWTLCIRPRRPGLEAWLDAGELAIITRRM